MILNKQSLEIWEKLQVNGNNLYSKFSQFNLSTENRKDVIEFKKFSKFSGNVLDIGCGPVTPSYLRNNTDVELIVGIDPLLSFNNNFSEENIDLMKAIGEFLPFDDDSFDFVCFGTSFDHVLDPDKVLNESKRVLKKNGNLVFWTDAEPKKNGLFKRAIKKTKRFLVRKNNSKNDTKYATLIDEQQKLVESMEIPSGALDQFHLRHVKFDELNALCLSLNFEQIKKKQLDNNVSLFVKYKTK